MYAQVVTTAMPPARVPELDDVVRNELLCRLREEPGFSGALSMVDRATGEALVVIFWETEEQAARPVAALSALSARWDCGSTVWELDARA